jgi:hypothetical protein
MEVVKVTLVEKCRREELCKMIVAVKSWVGCGGHEAAS